MPKSNLYTRTGDNGTTSLIGGKRIAKDSLRLEAYGTVDEFSSFLGMIAADVSCPEEAKGQITEMQNLLFNIGSYLATPVDSDVDLGIRFPDNSDISRLEGWIDALDEQTPPIRAFVLPGGSMLAAKTHVARSVCRRAERRILSLANEEPVDPMLISYINRLSDYLFVLARYFNFMAGVSEIVWKKN